MLHSASPTDIDIELLRRAVVESRDGIVITDATLPDNPLIFVNPAFERMTGYSRDEVVGRNCRFLQGDLRDQRALDIIRESVQRGEPCIVTLQNIRKDGSLFWNELSLSPIRDTQGRLTHFMGIQKDVSAEKLVEFALREEKQELQQMRSRLERESQTDALTGLYNRRTFDLGFSDLMVWAEQERVPLVVAMVDIDYFKKLNDAQGHLAGDQALREVAQCLKQSRRRGSDLVARYGGEEFVMVFSGLTEPFAGPLIDRLAERVRDLRIANAGVDSGVLTVSVGWVLVPSGGTHTPRKLLDAADHALYAAKQAGRNRAVRGELSS